jgi:hypothetical protein
LSKPWCVVSRLADRGRSTVQLVDRPVPSLRFRGCRANFPYAALAPRRHDSLTRSVIRAEAAIPSLLPALPNGASASSLRTARGRLFAGGTGAVPQCYVSRGTLTVLATAGQSTVLRVTSAESGHQNSRSSGWRTPAATAGPSVPRSRSIVGLQAQDNPVSGGRARSFRRQLGHRRLVGRRPLPPMTHSPLSSIGSYVRRREFSHLYSGYRLHCSTPGLTSRRCSTWNLCGVAGWPTRQIGRGETASRWAGRVEVPRSGSGLGLAG